MIYDELKVENPRKYKRFQVDLFNRLATLELDDEQYKKKIVDLQQLLNLALEQPENHKKKYHNAMNGVLSYLKGNYDMVPKGTYASQYMGFGIAIGTGLGIALSSSMPSAYVIGIGVGLVFGSGIGQRKEKEAKENGKLF